MVFNRVVGQGCILPPEGTWGQTGSDIIPPLERMTDTCKNTTFPQLRLWVVEMLKCMIMDLLPPANEVAGGNVFTLVSPSTGGGGYVTSRLDCLVPCPFHGRGETVERQNSRSLSNGRILTHPLRHHIRHSVELFCCEVEM